MSGYQRQGTRLCQETIRAIIINVRNRIGWGGAAELRASLQKMKKGVGGNNMEKVCTGLLAIKETEKQCPLDRPVNSCEW